jgi:hypothetical protein
MLTLVARQFRDEAPDQRRDMRRRHERKQKTSNHSPAIGHRPLCNFPREDQGSIQTIS